MSRYQTPTPDHAVWRLPLPVTDHAAMTAIAQLFGVEVREFAARDHRPPCAVRMADAANQSEPELLPLPGIANEIEKRHPGLPSTLSGFYSRLQALGFDVATHPDPETAARICGTTLAEVESRFDAIATRAAQPEPTDPNRGHAHVLAIAIAVYAIWAVVAARNTDGLAEFGQSFGFLTPLLVILGIYVLRNPQR